MASVSIAARDSLRCDLLLDLERWTPRSGAVRNAQRPSNAHQVDAALGVEVAAAPAAAPSTSAPSRQAAAPASFSASGSVGGEQDGLEQPQSAESRSSVIRSPSRVRSLGRGEIAVAAPHEDRAESCVLPQLEPAGARPAPGSPRTSPPAPSGASRPPLQSGGRKCCSVVPVRHAAEHLAEPLQRIVHRDRARSARSAAAPALLAARAGRHRP